MADDLMTALRTLANHWTMKARDFARASKDESADEAQANYNRGFAEGYYRAATELAALIKEQQTARDARPQPKPVSSAGASPQRAAPAQRVAPAAPHPAPPPTNYAPVTVAEALSVLEFAGTAARDVIQNKDNSFHAIFSRWENMMPHERIERIQKADARIVILNNGKLESHDHFVDFAFKEA